MLINVSLSEHVDPHTAAILASISGNSNSPVKLADGVYQIGHFGASSFMRGFEHYPELSGKPPLEDPTDRDAVLARAMESFHDDTYFSPYGVCDSYEQVLELCPALQDPARKFVLTVKRVSRDNQPSDGGWSWHKWGPYIGTGEPQCEYLYDEPLIESVLIYHIYEQK